MYRNLIVRRLMCRIQSKHYLSQSNHVSYSLLSHIKYLYVFSVHEKAEPIITMIFELVVDYMETRLVLLL